MKFLDRYNPERPLFPQIEQFRPGQHAAVIALRELTEGPVELRQRFLDEYTAYLASESPDPEVRRQPRAVALTNIGFFTGDYEHDQGAAMMAAWREADPAIEHPVFGATLPETAQAAFQLGQIEGSQQ